jgi:hypothetical protein
MSRDVSTVLIPDFGNRGIFIRFFKVYPRCPLSGAYMTGRIFMGEKLNGILILTSVCEQCATKY